MVFFPSAPAFTSSCQGFCSGIFCPNVSQPRGDWLVAAGCRVRRQVLIRAQMQSRVCECVLGAAVLQTLGHRPRKQGAGEEGSPCTAACCS